MHKSAMAPAVDMTARDRHLRLHMNDKTPAERLAAMRLLLERTWAMLQRNPVASLFESSREVEGIRFVSLEWLRRLKAAAGRPKALLDLENLPPA